jgi:hypothetical protein
VPRARDSGSGFSSVDALGVLIGSRKAKLGD